MCKPLDAKKALDNLIQKSRVHLYKPIQIAEILYHARVDGNLDLLDLEQYRTISKKWRDDICIHLLGRVCTSSSKFQDNLFDDNAIPPKLLNILGQENERTKGGVEAYIYNGFASRRLQLSKALNYCLSATKETFKVKEFIDSFWNEPGLKRSIDKIYEIVVYSLFNTIVDSLELKVEVSINTEKKYLLEEFQDFTQKIMCIDTENPVFTQLAKIHRVGVTNAADRGLDMYSNWGPAIQIKHLTLDEDLASEIVSGISSDRIIIVCKDAEKRIIVSLLSQIGWKSRIQSIVTESDLIEWYHKALRGNYSDELGDKLLQTLIDEISEEFPSVSNDLSILTERHYEKLSWGI